MICQPARLRAAPQYPEVSGGAGVEKLHDGGPLGGHRTQRDLFFADDERAGVAAAMEHPEAGVV